MSDTKAKKADFESQLAKLEEIVAWFESGEVTLDKSIKKFEQGMELAKELEERLKVTQNKIEVIKKKFDQTV